MWASGRTNALPYTSNDTRGRFLRQGPRRGVAVPEGKRVQRNTFIRRAIELALHLHEFKQVQSMILPAR